MAADDTGMEDVGDVDHSRRPNPNPNPISSPPSSSSSAPLPSSPAHCGKEDEEPQCGSDRMVKMELDAARTLADFAQMALLERENRVGEAGGKVWGNTGRRTRKRINNAPPSKRRSPDSGISRTNLGDLNVYQDANSAEYHQQHVRGGDMVEERVKLQQNSESPDTKVKNSRSQASLSTGRAKQNLTEAEKEEKRLRRVYANRESARQTIHRRQVLCEELIKKAADLSRENESMKTEKELALKEYLSLKDANRKLKEKAARTISFEVKEGPPETASIQVETPSSSATKHPPVSYNRPPFTQFRWPSTVQALHPARAHSNSQSTNEFFQKEVFGMNIESRPTLYMSPYPWFYPIIHPPPELSSHSLHSRSRKDDSKAEVITGERKDVMNIAKIPTQFSGDQMLKPYPTVLMPTPIRRVSPFNARSESENYTAVRTVTEDYPVKKIVDAAGAAEARKRRKELTKLKTLHGGQVGMQC